MKMTKQKAFSYITQGTQLLVFEHPHHPEAGIQVPAGRIEAGETPEEGALREAQEETGLQQLSVDQFLGEQTRDMSDFGKNEIHHRYFYHLTCTQKTPMTWDNIERFPSDQSNHDGDIEHMFRFYWLDIFESITLIADHDFYVPKLRKLLRTNQNKTY